MSKKTESAAAVAEVKPKQIFSAETIAKEIKPLSKNGFVAFWQKIWRAYLGWWYGFSDRHPKGSKWIYKIAFFLIFSNGVTLWQMLLFAVLPYAFAGLNTGAVWGWPNIEVIPGLVYPAGWDPAAWVGEPVTWLIFGDAAGIGTWLAFEIAVFTAQCINLPLQRNITFKSKGNIAIQAIWYFIGWVGISIAMGALWGIMMIPMVAWGWAPAGILVLKTVITGGVSMAVFFPIFVIIFPDLKKVAKKKQAKLDKLRAANAPAEVIAKAELAANKANEDARLKAASDAKSKAATQANVKAIAYLATVNKCAQAKAAADDFYKQDLKDKGDQFKAKAEWFESRIPMAAEKASLAIEIKNEAIETYNVANEEVVASRLSRGETADGKKPKAA